MTGGAIPPLPPGVNIPVNIPVNLPDTTNFFIDFTLEYGCDILLCLCLIGQFETPRKIVKDISLEFLEQVISDLILYGINSLFF